ncbi:MAG: TIGR01244 family sulfur transferase [Paracoccaceae bacterium]|nr:TIGR01244 family sulfur transferase [Paracoccaceae bacterium]
MDMRQLPGDYFVSPQLQPEDAADIAQAGIVRVICNRPDQEVPTNLQADAIGEAVRAAGMEFVILPITHQTMTTDVIAHHTAQVTSASGPVLAYCASGTRSSVIWALGQAGTLPTDQILASTASAGYDLEGLRSTLDSLS